MSRGTRERGPGSPLPFGYGAFTLSGPPFQDGSPRERIGNSPTGPQPGPAASHNPPRATPAGLAPAGFGLPPLSLATTQGISSTPPSLAARQGPFLISVPPGTEMFQFPGFPPHRVWIPRWVTGHDPRRVSPFGDVRIAACSAAPRTFRRRQRPSSAPDAKASTVRPFSLDGFPLRSSWKELRTSALTLALAMRLSRFAPGLRGGITPRRRRASPPPRGPKTERGRNGRSPPPAALDQGPGARAP